MTQEGPQLEALTRRLAECPADFLADPKSSGGQGTVEVSAVVFDLIRDLGGRALTKKELESFKASNAHTRLVLITCWLLHDIWFRSRVGFGEKAFALLSGGLIELAKVVAPTNFVSDPDRREELARFCLRGLDLRPAGESQTQAQDRLTTLDSVERARVIKAAREAEERARQVREEMRRKAEEEAAASWGRE
jgi:hypothetical protein